MLFFVFAAYVRCVDDIKCAKLTVRRYMERHGTVSSHRTLIEYFRIKIKKGTISQSVQYLFTFI